MGPVMKPFLSILRSLRRPTPPVYQQLELPLGGIRLKREEWEIVGELRRLRENLARS
jgi:hypothetical protein